MIIQIHISDEFVRDADYETLQHIMGLVGAREAYRQMGIPIPGEEEKHPGESADPE